MIILTNCLTLTADEGSLKVANSLIKRIKQAAPETTVVSYERQSPLSDRHLSVNKLLLNLDLIRLLRKKREPVLYVPFPARALPTALRIFILSRFARWGLRTVVSMQRPMGKLAGWLTKISGAQILTISRPTWEIYRKLIGSRAVYLKTGVDTKRFCPIDAVQKTAIRKKYGLPEDKPIVLHVGHLNAGRNVGQLLQISEDWHGVLVVSSLTAAEQDQELKARILAKPNLTLLEDYIPTIEEIYQLADVYLFPVAEAGNCIDVPLSALEAAACGIPVVATAYGELQELLDKPGFYPIETFEPAALEALLQKAAAEKISPRESVLDYDWEITVKEVLT